jgi:predicted metalloprotease
MVRWKRNSGFDRIEDRRGQGGGGLGGMLGGGGGGGGIPIPIPGGKAGGGIGGLIIVVVIFLLTSGILGGGSGFLGGGGPAEPGGTLDPQNETDRQLAAATASIQDFWIATFQAAGRELPMNDLVLFEGSTSSACGPASSATGPFYCPADQRVYLDLGFFDELQSRFGAQGGDFAIAYVVAHEFGHHVQTVTGISEAVQREAQADPDQANDLSVRQELQADCYAGLWANSERDIIEPGDIEEGISAAEAVGDDRIQQSTQGRIDPESWTHGSSEQRVEWFMRGFESGDLDACDTFAQ